MAEREMLDQAWVVVVMDVAAPHFQPLHEARVVVAELIGAADEVVRTGKGLFRLRRALADAKGGVR